LSGRDVVASGIETGAVRDKRLVAELLNQWTNRRRSFAAQVRTRGYRAEVTGSRSVETLGEEAADGVESDALLGPRVAVADGDALVF
jgi:hypothetical protein